MASVKFDGEAMTGHAAAVGINPAANFFTVADHRQQPLVFSLGNDNLFYMTKIGDSGDHELVNLAQKLGLGSDHTKVSSFGVSQDQSGVIYLTTVHQSGSSTFLNVFQPMEPDSFQKDSLAHLAMSHTITDYERQGRIVSVKVGSASPTESYPAVLVCFKEVRSISTTQDLARIIVDDMLESYTITKDITLPSNANKILDMCPVTTDFGPAVATLYHIQNQEKIAVITVDDYYGGKIKGQLEIPSGMNGKALTTAYNGDGYTNLLVGGQGLFHCGAYDLLSGGKMSCITKQGVFSDLQAVHSVQTEDKWTIWGNHSTGSVGYVSLDLDNPTPLANPVTVLPTKQGGRISPFISAVTGRQEFMVVNNDGQLVRLHQDTNYTGIWKTVPYFVPSLEKVLSYDAFMVHCTLLDAKGVILVGKQVSMKASGSVSARVKGRPIDLDPEQGVSVMTDARGNVEFLVSRHELSSFTYSFSDITGNNYFRGQTQYIYPDDRIYDKFADIKTGNDLKNTRLPSGKRLVDPSTDQKTLDNVAAAVQHLRSTRKDMKDNPSQTVAISERKSRTPPKLVHRSQLVCGSNLDKVLSNTDSIIDTLWDSWNGLVNSVEKIVTWAIQQYEEGGIFYLIFEIGEQLYRWEISVIAHIGKALWSLWKKILEGIELLLEFIEFLFEWKDIQATHKSLTHIMNNGLNLAINSVSKIQRKAGDLFDDLENEIRNLKPVKDSTPLNHKESGKASDEGSDLRKNASFNYMFHQVQYGGAADSSTIGDTITGDPAIDTFIENVLKPTAKSVEDSIQTLGIDLKNLWQSKDSNITVGDITGTIGVDLLVGLIDVLKTIITGGLSFTTTALQSLSNVLNFEINIPVISWLYETYISGGTKLTILDALCIILAIPVTIGYKLLHNAAPPDLASLDLESILSGKTKLTLEQNSVMGTMAITSVVLMGILSAVDVFTTNSTATALEHATIIGRKGKPKLMPTLQTTADLRFRATCPLLTQAQILVTKPGPKLSKIWGLRKNPFLRGFAFLGIRAFTVAGPALEPQEDLAKMKAYSWGTAFLVDLTDVIVHYLLADMSPEKEVMKAVAVIGLAAELISSGLDLGVTTLRAMREGASVSTIVEMLGAVGYLLSCVMDTLGVIDEELESETVLVIAGGVGLGVGVGGSITDLMFDALEKFWNVQLNVRL
ncbi:hypothetical protein OCU04_011101 [Sclerotinia nivalis]|uniref:Uncharacterized protein n=1 Tax=Sclerotinia nivalis TaxID=352851 RepID=A0A9X0AAZ4_9HELO|nr:hypothetical protein OCU04_011101 [Sclerotinia nivalis]